MASRSSLVVNARVHLSGSRGRSAVITNNVEYVATREGADKSATVDDLRRYELAERMGLVGYCAERPGSTALFDQNGAVQLRTARKELEKADGAIATVVLSVRRDEACELDLACKEDCSASAAETSRRRLPRQWHPRVQRPLGSRRAREPPEFQARARYCVVVRWLVRFAHGPQQARPGKKRAHRRGPGPGARGRV